MSDKFWNTVRGQIDNQIAQIGHPRHGIVASVNPANATARLILDEGDPANGIPPTLSGWLPICQNAAGNGWGMVTLPIPGTQVFFAPDMGDMSHGVILGAVHSTDQPPGKVIPYAPAGTTNQPQPITPGETTLIHQSGVSLRLTATGVEINGDFRVNGNGFFAGQVTAMDGAGAVHLSTHTHTQDSDAHGDGEQPTNAPTPGS